MLPPSSCARAADSVTASRCCCCFVRVPGGAHLRVAIAVARVRARKSAAAPCRQLCSARGPGGAHPRVTAVLALRKIPRSRPRRSGGSTSGSCRLCLATRDTGRKRHRRTGGNASASLPLLRCAVAARARERAAAPLSRRASPSCYRRRSGGSPAMPHRRPPRTQLLRRRHVRPRL